MDVHQITKLAYKNCAVRHFHGEKFRHPRLERTHFDCAPLLDTHTLLWLLDSPELSSIAKAAIANGTRRVVVSTAGSWEIAIKHQLGKLPLASDIVECLPRYLRKERFEILPINLDPTLAAGALAGSHRDPFDRMLIVQAKIERFQLVSRDAVFNPEFPLADAPSLVF